jgi:pyrroline-5-carboxylate reductase
MPPAAQVSVKPTFKMPQSLALFGAGNMGGAMLESWLEAGLNPHDVVIHDPNLPREVESGFHARGMRVNIAFDNTHPLADVVILAVKPQVFDQITPHVVRVMHENSLVVSIMAGIELETIKFRLPGSRAIVRAMPNLPAAIRRSMTVAIGNRLMKTAQKEIVEGLLKACGKVEWLKDENLMDAVTAVSGSGPAYIFYLTECLTLAAIDAGLPSQLAERLARETVSGAGELLRRSDISAARLRRSVTSPGGTTAAALEQMVGETGLLHMMVKAVKAAKERAQDLSDEVSKI